LDAARLDAWLASPEVAPPAGESFAAVARRVRRGREAVLAAHPQGTVVVVTHVTPIKTLIRLTLDAPPSAMFRLHLDTASVSIVDYYADGNSSVQLVNDTSHLR
jgi:probable phosphoglycerate mutase